LSVDKINEMCGIKGELLQASLFTCGRCKSVKTTSTQKQTRSADEPMTVFVCESSIRCLALTNVSNYLSHDTPPPPSVSQLRKPLEMLVIYARIENVSRKLWKDVNLLGFLCIPKDLQEMDILLEAIFQSWSMLKMGFWITRISSKRHNCITGCCKLRLLLL
jgi:hypothetical protein